MLLLVLGIFLLVTFSGCDTQKELDRERERGRREGFRDGQMAGYGEGYQNTFEPTRAEAYDTTITQLHSGGQFTRQRFYTILLPIIAVLLGFGIQYGLLYLLRRKEILFDIDRIILRKQSTAVDLRDLSIPQPPLPPAHERPGLPSSSGPTRE